LFESGSGEPNGPLCRLRGLTTATGSLACGFAFANNAENKLGNLSVLPPQGFFEELLRLGNPIRCPLIRVVISPVSPGASLEPQTAP